MWIFCGGMVRSGSTLQFQIAAHLVEHFGLGRRMQWVPSNEFSTLRDSLKDSDEWLVCKSHDLSPEMREEVNRGNAVVLCSHRDLRDVVVSVMRKERHSFQAIWNSRRLNVWVNDFESWAALPDSLVTRYSELKNSPGQEALRIAHRLKIEIDDSLIKEVDQEFSLENQKKRIESFDPNQISNHVRHRYDANTLLHHNHIASGADNEYQSYLMPHQIAAIEDARGDWLQKRGYSLTKPKLSFSEHSRLAMLKGIGVVPQFAYSAWHTAKPLLQSARRAA